MEFPGYPGLPERPVQTEKIPDFLRCAQKKRFDLLIQLHGSGALALIESIHRKRQR